MSVDGNIASITGVGGLGGGGAAAVAELAGSGNSILIGLAVGLALVIVSAAIMRKSHRNLAETE